MDLIFKVRNQKLELIDKEYLVNHAHNYHEINIDFQTPDWADKTIFIILKNSKKEAYRFHYSNDVIKIPSAVVAGGSFKISAYGVDTQQNRITTNELGILLHKSGYTSEISEIPDEEIDIIADIYQQLDLKLDISRIEKELNINSTNPVQNGVITGHLNDKSDVGHNHVVNDVTDFPSLSNVALSGSYNDLSHKPTIESLGGVVNIIQQGVPDGDYLATYIITQNGSQVGCKINIPKDKLLKSAVVEECVEEDVPSGFHVGDIYLDLVFNTAEGSGTDVHQYVDLTKLIDIYTADNTTMQLVNGVFSVKAGGIGATQLASEINTKLGYAETFNNSPCKNITTNDILNWNGKQTTGNLVTSFGSTLSDTKYPSEKLVKNYVDDCIGNIIDYVNG